MLQIFASDSYNPEHFYYVSLNDHEFREIREIIDIFYVNAKKVTKRERVEATVLNSLLPISKQEICYVLPDVSPTTVEAALATMLKDGLIAKVGSSRNTKYIKKQ